MRYEKDSTLQLSNEITEVAKFIDTTILGGELSRQTSKTWSMEQDYLTEYVSCFIFFFLKDLGCYPLKI